MIECIIDGKRAVPAASSNIKVTLENPYVKDSGEYTYDISFPMDIAENRGVFGNVHRFEVKKLGSTFEACRLFADGILVAEGNGIITTVNNKEVKLQIVGGQSRVKYNSKFEKMYIDEVRYPCVEIDQGLDTSVSVYSGGTWQFAHDSYDTGIGSRVPYLAVDLSKATFVGKKGVAAFCPVWDEATSCYANHMEEWPDMRIETRDGWQNFGQKQWMKNIAVQPNFLHVLRHVLKVAGFTIERNDLDCEPWTRLYFANANRTTAIRRALPHWTAYQFIEEVRKLFGVTFIFNESSKTVNIVRQTELTSSEVMAMECLDDYTMEREDEGLSTAVTANLEFDMGSSINRSWAEVVPKAVWEKFAVVENDPREDTTKLSRTDQTVIFHHVATDSYFVFSYDDDKLVEMTLIGYFGQLIRDEESDSTIKLKLVPAAMAELGIQENASGKIIDSRMKGFFASVESNVKEDENNLTQDDSGEYFQSVRDALESGEVEVAETSDDEDIEPAMLMFVSDKYVRNAVSKQTLLVTETSDNRLYRFPVTFTDCCQNKVYVPQWEKASLALQAHGITMRGADPTERVGVGTKPVMVADKHNAMTIQFIYDGVPDPKAIYAFRGKRFICSKIEMNVTEMGLDRLKTGYFYALSE